MTTTSADATSPIIIIMVRRNRKRRRRPLLLRRFTVQNLVVSLMTGVLVFLCTPHALVQVTVEAQVPGMVYTESGYDNFHGADPICWYAHAYDNHSEPLTRNDDDDERHRNRQRRVQGRKATRRKLSWWIEGPATSVTNSTNNTTGTPAPTSSEEETPPLDNARNNTQADENDNNHEHEEHTGTDTSHNNDVYEEHHVYDFAGVNWHSDLVPNFRAGPTTMLDACPAGTGLHLEISVPTTLSLASQQQQQQQSLSPQELHEQETSSGGQWNEDPSQSFRFRTHTLYTYHVAGWIDLNVIRKQFQLSSDAFFVASTQTTPDESFIGVRIEFCPVVGNLCSPFEEKEANLDAHLHHDTPEHYAKYHSSAIHDSADHDEHDEHSPEHDAMFHMPGAEFDSADHAAHEHQEHAGNDDEHESHDAFDSEEDDSHSEGGTSHDSSQAGHPGHVTTTASATRLFLIPVSASGDNEYNHNNGTLFEFDVNIDIKITEPGHYIPLASIQFFLSNETVHGHEPGIFESSAAMKFDMANLLHDRAIDYYAQPEILTVADGVLVTSYILIAACGAVQLGLLISTFWHFKDPVLQLAQGSFLIVLQLAGLLATASSCLLNPKNNTYCYLQGPLTLIPLQLMLAVVLGRLRRIIYIMRPLLEWNSCQQSSQSDKRGIKLGLRAWKNAFMFGSTSSKSSTGGSGVQNRSVSEQCDDTTPNGINGSRNNQNDSTTAGSARSWRLSWIPASLTRSITDHLRRQAPVHQTVRRPLRRTYTASHLVLFIIFITSPMVVLEIIGLTVFTPSWTLHMNDDESIGRHECGDSRAQIYYLSSTSMLFVTLFAALREAHRSQRLPALFNEAKSVWAALISSLFVACLGLAIILATAEPSASPGPAYLMEVVIVCYISSSLSLRLVLPKLQLIWKGEKVVMGKILADHKKTIATKNNTTSVSGVQPSSGSVHVSGLDDSRASSVVPRNSSTTGSVEFDLPPRPEEIPIRCLDKSLGRIEEGEVLEGTSGNAIEDTMNKSSTSQETKTAKDDHEAKRNQSAAEITAMNDVEATPNASKKPAVATKVHLQRSSVLVKVGKAPPTRLVGAVVRSNQGLSRLNERIMTGLQVDQEDWEDVKESTTELVRLLESIEYR